MRDDRSERGRQSECLATCNSYPPVLRAIHSPTSTTTLIVAEGDSESAFAPGTTSGPASDRGARTWTVSIARVYSGDGELELTKTKALTPRSSCADCSTNAPRLESDPCPRDRRH